MQATQNKSLKGLKHKLRPYCFAQKHVIDLMVRGSKIIVEEKQLNKIAKEKREKKTLYGERKTTQRLDDAKIIKG